MTTLRQISSLFTGQTDLNWTGLSRTAIPDMLAKAPRSGLAKKWDGSAWKPCSTYYRAAHTQVVRRGSASWTSMPHSGGCWLTADAAVYQAQNNPSSNLSRINRFGVVTNLGASYAQVIGLRKLSDTLFVGVRGNADNIVYCTDGTNWSLGTGLGISVLYDIFLLSDGSYPIPVVAILYKATDTFVKLAAYLNGIDLAPTVISTDANITALEWSAYGLSVSFLGSDGICRSVPAVTVYNYFFAGLETLDTTFPFIADINNYAIVRQGGLYYEYDVVNCAIILTSLPIPTDDTVLGAFRTPNGGYCVVYNNTIRYSDTSWDTVATIRPNNSQPYRSVSAYANVKTVGSTKEVIRFMLDGSLVIYPGATRTATMATRSAACTPDGNELSYAGPLEGEYLLSRVYTHGLGEIWNPVCHKEYIDGTWKLVPEL